MIHIFNLTVYSKLHHKIDDKRPESYMSIKQTTVVLILHL